MGRMFKGRGLVTSGRTKGEGGIKQAGRDQKEALDRLAHKGGVTEKQAVNEKRTCPENGAN